MDQLPCHRIELTQYNEKSIVARGEFTDLDVATFEQFGGKYNDRLKGGAGYIFPTWRLPMIEQYLLGRRMRIEPMAGDTLSVRGDFTEQDERLLRDLGGVAHNYTVLGYVFEGFKFPANMKPILDQVITDTYVPPKVAKIDNESAVEQVVNGLEKYKTYAIQTITKRVNAVDDEHLSEQWASIKKKLPKVSFHGHIVKMLLYSLDDIEDHKENSLDVLIDDLKEDNRPYSGLELRAACAGSIDRHGDCDKIFVDREYPSWLARLILVRALYPEPGILVHRRQDARGTLTYAIGDIHDVELWMSDQKEMIEQQEAANNYSYSLLSFGTHAAALRYNPSANE